MTQMHVIIDANIIDANIVVGYFKETVKGAIHDLTVSPTSLFESLGSSIVCYVDDGGHIEAEWSRPVEPEWFNAWYSDLLISDSIRTTETDNCRDLKKQLKDLGFPTTTKDFLYCRVGVAVSKKNGKANLITEDLDFYEPSEKECGGPRRKQLLCNSRGQVAKHLRRESDIEVICVDKACSLLAQI